MHGMPIHFSSLSYNGVSLVCCIIRSDDGTDLYGFTCNIAIFDAFDLYTCNRCFRPCPSDQRFLVGIASCAGNSECDGIDMILAEV